MRPSSTAADHAFEVVAMLSPDDSARQRAVQAALRVVAAHGIEHLTTRSLAREVGLTQPAIYRHFNGKNALIREVHHAVAALFRQAPAPRSPRSTTPFLPSTAPQ